MDPDSIFAFLYEIYFYVPTLTAVVCGSIAFILLFVSGFISASEVAFFSLSPQDKNEMEESKLPADLHIRMLLQRADYLLAAILIVNNFVNVSIIILLEMFINSVIHFGNSALAQFLFQTIFLTFLLLLLGEIMPKIYASQHSLRFARRSAPIFAIIEKILRPISYLLVRATSKMNKGILKRNVNISMDELSHALELTSDEIKEEKEILQEVIKFGNKMVVDVMTPRLDISFIDRKSTFSEALKKVIECGYSRIPVYSETQDSIEGILYAKDLLPHLDKTNHFKWQALIRTAYFVPETKKIDDLLEEFQQMKTHLAIVVDEYGGTAGLISMEDILEEIVGDISDEYDDDDERLYIEPEKGTFIFEAKISLNDFFKITNLDEDLFEELTSEADTLAGLILEISGNFPKRREWIEYKEYKFQILEMDKRRILKVKFICP